MEPSVSRFIGQQQRRGRHPSPRTVCKQGWYDRSAHRSTRLPYTSPWGRRGGGRGDGPSSKLFSVLPGCGAWKLAAAGRLPHQSAAPAGCRQSVAGIQHLGAERIASPGIEIKRSAAKRNQL